MQSADSGTLVTTNGELHDDVIGFLSSGTRTAMVSYTAADGRPLIAPVWFLVEDDLLLFSTGLDTAKGRALQRDNRVALCVDDDRRPYSFVQIQGTTTLSNDPDDVVTTARRSALRYVENEVADEWVRRIVAPDEVVVRVHPTKVISHLA